MRGSDGEVWVTRTPSAERVSTMCRWFERSLPVVLGQDDQVIAAAVDRLTDALDQVAGMVDRHFCEVEHQGDHVGSPGAQANARVVGNIAQGAGCGLDSAARVLAKVLPAAQ
jgi:hypothetical protein